MMIHWAKDNDNEVIIIVAVLLYLIHVFNVKLFMYQL